MVPYFVLYAKLTHVFSKWGYPAFLWEKLKGDGILSFFAYSQKNGRENDKSVVEFLICFLRRKMFVEPLIPPKIQALY